MKATEWYEEVLPADVVVLATHNLMRENPRDPVCASLIDALSQFSWQDSPEGWKFWCDIAAGNNDLTIFEHYELASERMIDRGGHFAASLGRAYRYADSSNRCRLAAAFSQVFKKFF